MTLQELLPLLPLISFAIFGAVGVYLKNKEERDTNEHEQTEVAQ